MHWVIYDVRLTSSQWVIQFKKLIIITIIIISLIIIAMYLFIFVIIIIFIIMPRYS